MNYRPGLIGEKVLTWAFCICLASAIIPTALCYLQLSQSRAQILELGEIRSQTRQARLLSEQIAQSAYNFMSAALDLTADERDALFAQTDQQLASLNTTLLVRGQLLASHLSGDENAELSATLASISETWEDIREKSKEGLTGTERAFHFLSLYRDVNTARRILGALQLRVDQAADRGVSSVLELSRQMSFYLLLAMSLGATLTLMALYGAYRLLKGLANSNLALSSAIVDLNIRDAELNAQNERFAMALNNMSQGLCMFDASRRLIVCNAQFGALYRLPSRLMEQGTSLGEILQYCLAQDLISPQEAEHIEATRNGLLANMQTAQSFLELRDGRIIRQACQAMPHGGWVGTHEDITEQRKAESRIAHMAHHDALTELPNRTLFRQELERAIANAQRGGTLAVLYLDLDHFKSVNDTLGHPIGDILLRKVAERLKGNIGASDVVARLGGDEFAIYVPELNDLNYLTGLAQRLIDDLNAPFELDGHQVVVGTSIGIALAPIDGDDADKILKCADLALYRAKSEGRCVYRFFEPEMDARMQARRALELDLRKAFAGNEFEVYYQPLIQASTEQVTGFEALLRWRHPQRGFVSPSEFIPLAEEIGLIGRIGAWVLKQACEEASQWPSHIKIAVNLSPVQFRGQTLLLDVMAALGTSGLAPDRLELEITESVMLQDTASTLNVLHQLKNIGVRISMDDFGTGYSSLSYLRKFPFDKIKIDKSFVRDLTDKSDSAAIIRAVATLSADLGMATTAEGVETEEQFRKIKSEGCTEVQGYLFSRPRPACEVSAMLNNPRSSVLKRA